MTMDPDRRASKQKRRRRTRMRCLLEAPLRLAFKFGYVVIQVWRLSRPTTLACLVVLEEPQDAAPHILRAFPLTEGANEVGRLGPCQVWLFMDPYISRCHARIFIRNGRCHVQTWDWQREKTPTNPTYLNGLQIDGVLRRLLDDGDILRMSDTHLLFQQPCRYTVHPVEAVRRLLNRSMLSILVFGPTWPRDPHPPSPGTGRFHPDV